MDPLFDDESLDVLTQRDGLAETSFASHHAHFSQPQLETCLVDRETIVLPSQVCENASVLTEMLSSDLLSEVLTNEDVQQLQCYFPKSESEEERKQTWSMLFSRQNFQFGNPVQNFSRKLESGFFNPDIAQTRKLFQKLQKRNAKREQKNYYFNLLQSVIVSRQRLIEAASQLPPGQTVRVAPVAGGSKSSTSTNTLLTEERIRKRYFEELKAIDCYSSEDDNYPEGPPAPLSKKQRRHLCTIQGSLSCDIKPIQSTLTQNISNHLVVVDGDSRICDNKRPVIDVLSRVSSSKNVYEVNEETYKQMLIRHRTQKRETTSGDTRLEDVGQRVRLCMLNKRPPPAKTFELPKKNKVVSASSSSDEAPSEVEQRKKTKPKRTASRPSKTKAMKNKPEIVEPVEPIIAPCEIKHELIEPPVTPPPPTPPPAPSPVPSPPPPPSLTQDTHSCFFTLLREVLLNNEGPLAIKQVMDAVVVWSTSPISPLNDWYSQLMAAQQRVNGWMSLVQAALEFLVDHGLALTCDQIAYNWVGQGRDSDALLQDLSGIWLQQQQDTSLDGKLDVEGTSELNDSMLSSPPEPSLTLGSGLELGEDVSDVGSSSLFDSPDIVHPPRSVTTWTVRPSTAEEKAIYREQERQRYCQPHKAFTFRQHGYESIVGPVKGVYTPGQGVGQPSTKVRGHNLMVPERPACVTLLSLVRDAAARLPNGEGTRAEICELMKESQYLAPGAEASLHSVVSGALDRLHYEADPCVKYDSARKVWIYLHRHRTEAEFEQLHKQHQGMPSRVKKPRSEHRRSSGIGSNPAKAIKAPTSVPVPVASPPVVPIAQPVAITDIPTPTPMPVTVLKSTPVKVNNVIRQDVTKSPATPVVVATTCIPTPTTTVTSMPPSSSAPNTIQTFQITTSTGVQTIRVAAPANLPTALLARTLQMSAQQQGALQGPKLIGSPTLMNGNSTIKQVILSPPSAKSTTLLASPRATAPSTPPTSTASIIRLNIPASGMMANRARLPASPVRFAGRQAATSPVQTFLIRPPAPSTTGMSPSTAPRLVMVNNKLINLSSTSIAGPNTRIVRPNVAVNMANVRKAVPTTNSARPVLARVVSGPGGQQQQVITLENLLSLTNKGGAKTGMVQLPLSALAGLNVGASSSGNQPTTVLLQNVKGAQSILLPAGFQGGTINIRGVRLATVAQQPQQPATPTQQQPKQAFVARLVAPQQNEPPPPKKSDL